MSDEIRFQPTCYYVTSDGAKSFWHKYIYLYQGKGSLRLTRQALSLEQDRHTMTIPFKSIKSIALGRFSKMAKPLGLTRLEVTYLDGEGEPRGLCLVPFHSSLAPTPVTSQLVRSWYDSLAEIDELSGRIVPADQEPEPTSEGRAGFLIATVCLMMGVGITLIVACLRMLW